MFGREPDYRVGVGYFLITFAILGIASCTWTPLSLLALGTTVMGCWHTMPPEAE